MATKGIGIGVIGPVHLPYRKGRGPAPIGSRFRYCHVELDTGLPAQPPLMVAMGIVAEFQFTHGIVLVALARDLIPEKVLAHVPAADRREYFHHFSSRPAMEELFASRMPLVGPRGYSHLEHLRRIAEGTRLVVHEPVLIPRTQYYSSFLEGDVTYEEALGALDNVLFWIGKTEFLHSADPRDPTVGHAPLPGTRAFQRT